jgi:ribosome-associated heat shock protein Hsp15
MREPVTEPIRIDKWLWAARFYKTRALATEAIGGGKITLNGSKPKPGRHIAVGDRLMVRRPPFEYHIVVQALTKQRGSATIAAGLYAETEESRARREELAAQLHAERAGAPRYSHRPNKRERRTLDRYQRSGGGAAQGMDGAPIFSPEDDDDWRDPVADAEEDGWQGPVDNVEEDD